MKRRAWTHSTMSSTKSQKRQLQEDKEDIFLVICSSLYKNKQWFIPNDKRKKKFARSGIWTHAFLRRPEDPNPPARGKRSLESGALDHSAIRALDTNRRRRIMAAALGRLHNNSMMTSLWGFGWRMSGYKEHEEEWIFNQKIIISKRSSFG